MQLKFTRVAVVGLIAPLALTVAVTAAGTSFRLDIGPSVAASGFKKDAKTKEVGSFAVRALACDELRQVRMTGTAEGIVNGQRQSMPLRLVAMDTPGVFAVTRQWPEGTWVVNLTATCPSRSATAAVIVPIGSKGFVRESSRFLERAATVSEIDAALKTLSSQGRT